MTHRNTPHNPSVNRIIIVEDDADLRDSLVKYLTLRGYDVTGVGSAIEFYQHVSSDAYKLAILDIGLPDQNGLVLTEYLRNNTDMRIIILTAQSTLDDKIYGYHAGADVFIVKPVDVRELAATVSSLLGRVQNEHHNASSSTPETRNRQKNPVLPEESSVLQAKPVPSNKPNKARWTLVDSKWLLRSPNGINIQLTIKECRLMMILASGNKVVSTRTELLDQLEYLHNESGNRALESLVHRLRRKIAEHYPDAPVQTAQGVGYLFTEDIVIE